MSVLTKKEFERKFKKPAQIQEETQALPQVLNPVAKPLKKYTWILLHPENGVQQKRNFEDVIKIEGKEYTRKCENGVLRTSEEVLAKFLVSKKYILMEKIGCP